MKDDTLNPLEDTESEAALAYARERRENISTFVRTNPDYYIWRASGPYVGGFFDADWQLDPNLVSYLQ